MVDHRKETPKTLIGRAERLDFPELALKGVPARIDTGAKTSSLWASDIVVSDGVLHAKLLGPGHEFYTDKPVRFSQFDRIAISTSTGEVQHRFKIRLLVRLKGRKIRAWFTLADRSTQVYPVLIGRNVLMGKYIVDVKEGKVLKEAERQRNESLQAQLESAKAEEEV